MRSKYHTVDPRRVSLEVSDSDGRVAGARRDREGLAAAARPARGAFKYQDVSAAVVRRALQAELADDLAHGGAAKRALRAGWLVAVLPGTLVLPGRPFLAGFCVSALLQ